MTHPSTSPPISSRPIWAGIYVIAHTELGEPYIPFVRESTARAAAAAAENQVVTRMDVFRTATSWAYRPACTGSPA